MVRAPGIRVPLREAEATRRALLDADRMRLDLSPRREPDALVFPVDDAPDAFDFEARAPRARHYSELLDWPEADRAAAPRAFDQMGDIVVLKVPPALWDRRGDVGEALLSFLPAARAVFHDHGVVGEFRTRDLERIAGEGGPETTVTENGATLHIDVARAYFSPRLGDERARVAGLARPGERVIDLFGGVAPLGVQLARLGVEVVSVDLNPAAVDLARRNAEANKVTIELRLGDAREVARELAPADRVVMNLPHGAKHFLDAAAPLVRPGGVLHYHEILPDAALEARKVALVAELAALGRAATVEHVRHVRAYSPVESHYAFDVRLGGGP